MYFTILGLCLHVPSTSPFSYRLKMGLMQFYGAAYTWRQKGAAYKKVTLMVNV